MIVVLILICLTMLVLVAGVVLMAIGGNLNNKLRTKLMFLRVALQGMAVCLLFMLYLFTRS